MLSNVDQFVDYILIVAPRNAPAVGLITSKKVTNSQFVFRFVKSPQSGNRPTMPNAGPRLVRCNANPDTPRDGADAAVPAGVLGG
jgi:hypothetical protein